MKISGNIQEKYQSSSGRKLSSRGIIDKEKGLSGGEAKMARLIDEIRKYRPDIFVPLRKTEISETENMQSKSQLNISTFYVPAVLSIHDNEDIPIKKMSSFYIKVHHLWGVEY